MGNRSFKNPVDNVATRGAKSGVSMAAGALAAFAGAGPFSLPVTFLTRLGIDRTQLLGRVEAEIRKDRLELAALAASKGYGSDRGAGDVPTT